MPVRPAISVRWRRLIAAGLAWLLVAQAIGWSTHALTHLHQPTPPASELSAGSGADRGEPVNGDGGNLPAEHGCGLCGALYQGALALIPWPAISLPAPPAIGSATPIDLSDGYARPPVHHPSRAPPVPFHAV
ncbi:MAG TPA: hypothetical protein PKA20_16480 [Burkholderiaceae bacterium]|nr:hypothetical protein [Burkholderiaceae bacterium]